MPRTEIITRIEGPPTGLLAPGVELRVLATGAMGSVGLTTALASFGADTELPYHRHPFSEVIVVLYGAPLVVVEGRRYQLRPFDAMHVPAGTAHAVQNQEAMPAQLHSSFASDDPRRESVEASFPLVERVATDGSCPESLVRFDAAPIYELAPQARFRDLFARRFGSRGVCGGYGIFEPGSSLPCHFHEYDESITIVEGTAVCQVAGSEYKLSDNGTACIPKGRPHRFLNRGKKPMAMIWVYAGDEPERTLVDAGYCEGTIAVNTDGLAAP